MRVPDAGAAHSDFTELADDLATTRKAPQTTTRTRQRLARSLMTEMIVADVDEAAGRIVLVTHWKGGQQICASGRLSVFPKLVPRFSDRPHVKQ
jgi:hypothetical protein